MEEFRFPHLPDGQRWFVAPDLVGGRKIALQEYRKGWVLTRWRTVASERINPLLDTQRAIDRACKGILSGHNSKAAMDALAKRHQAAEKHLEKTLPLGPIEDK